MALLFDKEQKVRVNFFQKEKNMLKQYDDVEMKIIDFNNLDVVTASGDNYEDDPWGVFEY